MKAVFLDRDGTINAGVPKYERVDSVDKVEILPRVIEALGLLSQQDFLVFFITNQAGLAEGLITRDDFDKINNKVLDVVSQSGIKVQETYVCPHGESNVCECRKPKPKLLKDAAEKYDIDLSQSWMIGDRITDVQTGKNAGTKAILVQSGAILDSPEADFVAPTLYEAIEYIVQNN